MKELDITKRRNNGCFKLATSGMPAFSKAVSNFK